MRFDVDISGRYLGVGDQVSDFHTLYVSFPTPLCQMGNISLFELGSEDINMSTNQTPGANDDFVPKKSTAKLQFKAHNGKSGFYIYETHSNQNL